jgi:Spirocyclase AveC-like
MKAVLPAHTPYSRPLTKPIVFWSGLGACFLALTIYVYGAWMLSPDFKRTYPSVPLDETTQSLIFWNQLVFSAITIACLIYWVVLPKIRTGRFSFMGLLVLASATGYWADPISNYYSFGIAYSSGFWNMGSWANFIPGYSYPGMERLPEPWLFAGTTYVWFNVAVPALFVVMWKWMDRRFPRLGFGAVIVTLLFSMFMIDLIQEALYLRMGLYGYIGASHEWSVFGGHHYQFPIFIGVATAFFFLGYAWIMYFRDDKGFCFVERGVDKLDVSPRLSTFLRFLALVAYININNMVTYWLPVQYQYTHGDAIPSDTPAHLTNDLCGEKAGFVCPGRGVPIPRRDGNAS